MIKQIVDNNICRVLFKQDLRVIVSLKLQINLELDVLQKTFNQQMMVSI